MTEVPRKEYICIFLLLLLRSGGQYRRPEGVTNDLNLFFTFLPPIVHQHNLKAVSPVYDLVRKHGCKLLVHLLADSIKTPLDD